MDDTFAEKEKYILSLQKWCPEYKKEYQKLYYRIYLSTNKNKDSELDIKLYQKMRGKPPLNRKISAGSYSKINNNVLQHNTGLKIEKKNINITFD